jgi:transaldolase
VSAIREVLQAADTDTQLLAASVKTPAEVVETVLAGAQHLTLHLDLILALGEHPLSVQAIDDFERAMKPRKA